MKSLGLIFLFCLLAVVAQAQDSNALLQQASALVDQPDKALELLNQALISEPESEEILKVRAEVYEAMKQYDKAVVDYKKLILLSPDEEVLWYLMGRNYYKGNHYPEALKSLNRATKINPQYLPAFHTKIKTLLALNKDEQALKVSDSTLMVGETAMNYYLQGEVNKKLNARQKAEWAYAKATRIDKGFVEAYIALADLAAGMNKAEETLVNADAALGINPDSEEALIARSRGFALLKQYSEAIDDASYVIKLNPANTPAYYWRGTYYNESNKHQEALKDFNHVLQEQPVNWRAQAARADSYIGMGDKKAALADYQKLLAEAPNYPDKDAITQLSNLRIFELNREPHAPELVLINPEPDKFELQIPNNQSTVTLKGKITDESPIGKLIINGQKVPVTAVGNSYEFVATVELNDLQQLDIEVADVYDNVNKLSYQLVRNETGKPQIALFTPKPDDDGIIVLTPDNAATLYVEGKVTDQSTIASIVVDGKAIDFDHETTNPAFSAIIDINQKTKFSIIVTDRYGNIAEQTYTLEKLNTINAGLDTIIDPTQIPTVEQASH